MKVPMIPADEIKRKEALNKLEVLDTQAEDTFDEITELVCRMLNVPVAVISLVDSNRQWFKSQQGLDQGETPREISFCGHAVYDKKTLIVKDAKEDKRFQDNPMVVDGPKVRFYAGVPIIDWEGYALGTLCAIDTVPRELTDDQLKILKVLANKVYSRLVLRKEMIELKRSLAELERNHRLVMKIVETSVRAVAVVELDENGIWFILRNKVLDEAFSGGDPKFIEKSLKRASVEKVPLQLDLEKNTAAGRTRMKLTITKLEEEKDRKIFSLIGEYVA